MRGFRERRYLGIICRVDNLTCVAGHARLCGRDGTKGWSFFRYNQTAPGWALERVWSFGLFAIFHIGEGKTTNPPGWHMTFAKVERLRGQGEFGIRVRKANTFRVRPIA